MRKILAIVVLASSCATPDDVVPCIVGSSVAAGVCAIPIIALGGPRLAYRHEVPGFGTRMSDAPYDPRHIATLIETFLATWEERFGESAKVRDIVNRLDIQWVETPHMNTYGENSAGYMNGIGNVIRRAKVTIAWMPDVPLWETALTHELTHAALAATKGDPDDSKHSQPPGPWTVDVDKLVNDVNRSVRRRLSL